MSNIIPRLPGMTFEQRERAIGMLTTGMSARDVVPTPQIDNKSTTEQISANWECRLLNRFQHTGNFAERSRSGRQRKTTPQEDLFLMIHLDAIDFFLVESEVIC